MMKVTSGWNGVPYFETNPETNPERQRERERELLGLNRRSTVTAGPKSAQQLAVVDLEHRDYP